MCSLHPRNDLMLLLKKVILVNLTIKVSMETNLHEWVRKNGPTSVQLFRQASMLRYCSIVTKCNNKICKNNRGRHGQLLCGSSLSMPCLPISLCRCRASIFDLRIQALGSGAWWSQ